MVTSSSDFDIIKIGLASPDQIRFWSHGEVEKPETINYRTFKPEKKGLFDEKIFGPVKDWECSCGKYRRIRYRGIVCERCGVEITHSRVRRERMGHIELAVPVAHIWYLKGAPSYISVLLNVSSKLLEDVIYYDKYIVMEVDDSLKTQIKKKQILSENEYDQLKDKYGKLFRAGMGAGAVKELLGQIDLESLVARLRERMKKSAGQKKIKISKRLVIAEAFVKAGNRPDWMVLDCIPVMPPDLRPMVQLEGGRFATSDLNDLYRRVLNRNNRLRRLMEIGAPEIIVRNEKRMLQEAVDTLIDNGRRGRVVTGSNGRPLKSLSDIIEGKQGRFRQNLLGKRVDYSGRSVIVVGPHLKMYQCGLPKEMALELFKPYVINKLLEKGQVTNIRAAKRKIEAQDVAVWDILEEVIKNRPVLLNRAPTLHRLGVQAFEPVLVRGKAIQIHPLVCTAFNADFDGDQMAVHVPLSLEAQAETKLLMLSSHNLLYPSSGKPIVTPTQDMVLGCYYLTMDNPQANKGKDKAFADENEAIQAYDIGAIDLQAPIEVRMGDKRLKTTCGRIIFHLTVNRVINKWAPGKVFAFFNQTITKKRLEQLVHQCYVRFGCGCTADLADEIKELGFRYATRAGVSINIDDLQVPARKKEIIKKATEEVARLEKQYRKAALTRQEKYLKEIEIWAGVTEEVTEAMLKDYDKTNSVYMMAFSGARGSVNQVRQLAGMRGLMADPVGNVIDIPIKTNFREGLNMTEYFISSYGARKGLVDTALRTADSGYLTRRLVDVVQDIMITSDDCGTSRGITVAALKEGYETIIPIENRIVDRVAADDVVDPLNKKVIVKAGEVISEETANKIAAAGVESLEVRSPLTCRIKRGVCRKCYGKDLASGHMVNLGEAVGVIAAQAIGEPGTQLTMRTFHTGGVALHKASKYLIKAKHKGKVLFEEEITSRSIKDDDGKTVKVLVREAYVSVKVEGGGTERYLAPVGSILRVENGSQIERGKPLAEYDPGLLYIIVATEGRIAEFGLDAREKTGEGRGTERIARREGEIIVYNQAVTKEYEFPGEAEILVQAGDKVDIGTALVAGFSSSIIGVVAKVSKEAKHGKKTSEEMSLVSVHPGERYPILAGAKLYCQPGDKMAPGDILAVEETAAFDLTKTRDIIQGLPRVEELFEARRPKSEALLAELSGKVDVREVEGVKRITIKNPEGEHQEYIVPYGVRLKVYHGQDVDKGYQLTEGVMNPHDVLRTRGLTTAQRYLVDEIQKVYKSQGVDINDKHIEVIVRQMTRKVKIARSGDTDLLPGEVMDAATVEEINKKMGEDDKKPCAKVPVVLGITKASLMTESFFSAASFQETSRVLTEAAVAGKSDEMYGLKENVIIGKLIPAGTGNPAYRNLEIVGADGEVLKGGQPVEDFFQQQFFQQGE